MLKTLDRPASGNGRKSKSNSNTNSKIETLVVTPDIAKAWLDKNTHNRKPSHRHIAKLARDMIVGSFVFTGDPIRFDRSGRLIDGQHRLMACVKSEKPFETLVIYDLAPETQDKLDTGKARGANDVMALAGYHSASTLAAACRIICCERDGLGAIHNGIHTTSDVLGVLKRHKTLPSAVNEVHRFRYPRGISSAWLSVVYYVGRHMLEAPTTADAFIEVMTTGVPFSDGCAAHAFRERVLKTTGASQAMARPAKWRLMKHTWNMFAAGQGTKLLRAPDTVVFDGVDPSDW